MRVDVRLAAWGAVLLLCASPAPGLEPAHLVAGFPRGLALLETAGPRCVLIDTYFASTPEQRSQGLMYVQSLGEFEGMYFGYGSAVELTMWMKNTVLPLDMVFIRADGTVGRVARDTRPYSTERIGSGGEVIGVLELNAGSALRWGIAPGSRVWLF